MLGAIVGDIAGSRFEFANCPTDGTLAEFGMPTQPGFELLAQDCFITDDTILTLAVCQALLDSDGDRKRLAAASVQRLCEFARKWPDAGYGERFQAWVNQSQRHRPYNSKGNGSAMRVSGCAYAAETLEEVLLIAESVTGVTHNHPEGLKGAAAVAAATFLARKGCDKKEIRRFVNEHFYCLDFTLDEIRPYYWKQKGLATCGKSVPQALQAFFESDSFEEAIRLAVGLGGDTDTLAAMAAAPAAAYYGVPSSIQHRALSYLPVDLQRVLTRFEARFV